jgi:hypothetical protein
VEKGAVAETLDREEGERRKRCGSSKGEFFVGSTIPEALLSFFLAVLHFQLRELWKWWGVYLWGFWRWPLYLWSWWMTDDGCPVGGPLPLFFLLWW